MTGRVCAGHLSRNADRAHDRAGRMMHVADSLGQGMSYAHDNLGRLRRTIYDPIFLTHPFIA